MLGDDIEVGESGFTEAVFFFNFKESVLIKNLETDSFVMKPTRCTNFTNLFCHETLHVSDISSVHHQELIHRTLSNGICHTGL